MANEKLLKAATYASVCAASVLFVAKFIGWYITDSVAVLSSLMDSTMDLMVSLINFVALRYSLKPADDEHRFGHGKAADLASLAQSIFILALACTISLEAIDRFLNPVKIQSSFIGTLIMLFSLVTTISLVLFQKYVYKKTRSNLVKADALHYLSDILSNLAVMLTLFAGQFLDLPYLDPIMGILISIYILHGSWEIGRTAFDKLMDKEFNDGSRQRIEAIITSHPDVFSFHDLRIRHAGHKNFIQFSFKMNGETSLIKAHEIAHEIEAWLLKDFPDWEITIHQEPI